MAGSYTHSSSGGIVNDGGGSHSFGSTSVSSSSKSSYSSTIGVTTSSGKIIYPDTGIIPWMRYLYLEFTNENGQVMGIGGYDDSLSIVVKGTKTLASVGDSATINIYNLPMVTLLKLIQGKYTQSIKIYCGYYNTNKIKIFDGGVSYLEEGKSDKNTSVLKLQCANRLISDKLQTRLSLSLNSGINMYRAIEEITQAFGVSGQIEIDEYLKEDELKGALSKYATLRDWIEAVISSSSKNRDYAVTSDAKSGIATVMGYRKMGSGDTYVINTNSVNLQSFPTISSDGLSITLSPIYNMTPGDIISIDNTTSSLISALDSENTYMGNQKYLDKDGLYNIREMTYSLNNRSDSFEVEVLAISRSLLQTVMKGDSQ